MWILDRLAVSLLGSCDASVSRVEEVLELLRGLELLERSCSSSSLLLLQGRFLVACCVLLFSELVSSSGVPLSVAYCMLLSNK